VATAFAFLGLAVLVAAVAWRPHGWGPTLGATAAVLLTAVGGAVELGDVLQAAEAQWQAYITLAAVMTMTAGAESLGLLDRLAARIEPRTRGPVRHAFALTFAISALVAAVLSNDAAILLLTPTLIHLLRTVYPRRNPKFLVPFAVAVFAAAGVAPLVISNPMNLIFAGHVGLRFNRYAMTMIPIAIVGWITAYYVLLWIFRDALKDEDPALGAWPHAPKPMNTEERLVLAAVFGVLFAYPIMSYLGQPLWSVAAAGGVVTAAVRLRAGHGLGDLSRGITWTVFPFLMGVFIIAVALDRVGVVAWLHELYAATQSPIATIGVVSTLGSALLNNHPMSVLNAFALDGLPNVETHAFAALIGGDLGPRLLPVGSLASLLWYDQLRKHDVSVSVPTFIRTGALLTLPTLTVSLAALWLLERLM
jgi:arsenical pump membrane protein